MFFWSKKKIEKAPPISTKEKEASENEDGSLKKGSGMNAEKRVGKPWLIFQNI